MHPHQLHGSFPHQHCPIIQHWWEMKPHNSVNLCDESFPFYQGNMGPSQMEMFSLEASVTDLIWPPWGTKEEVTLVGEFDKTEYFKNESCFEEQMLPIH